jgi:signal transduction histidine kinase
MFETESRVLWWAVRAACAGAVNASESQIYLYDQERDQFQLLERDGQQHIHDRQIELAADHPALRAFHSRAIAEEIGGARLVCMAAPIFGQPHRAGPPLAVVMLHLRVDGASERRAAGLFLTELLDHIWPICAYASLRQQFPLLDQIGNREVYRLHLDEVIDVVLDTLCNRLGFSYATISLVNEDTREISTVRGKNVPPGWVADAHHMLNSQDIQADVVRTGQVEVIDTWDPRFDETIWMRYGHADLLRVWVPLGRIGTIEAGFYKNEKSEVPRLLVELVKRYSLDVTVAIQNAQHYEREQRQAVLMARLHEVSYDLQTDPCQRDETALLRQITHSALDLLGAGVIVLYPLNRRDGTFAPPIWVGSIEGRLPLTEPNEHGNIVQYIAETRLAYYQPDAQCDPQLVGEGKHGAAAQGHRTFTKRQNILSFAGVPLLARGKLLGVLCVNYRARRQFSAQDRQVIELFAQQAAAVIAGGELVRNQERRRLEYDLHDSVKSGLRGLILFSKAASDALEHDPARARKQLHEIRRSAWVILGDVELILHDLAQNGNDGKLLQHFIREDLRRLVGHDSSKVILDLHEDLPALPMLLTRTMLYVMREALMNALEHAQAATIRVSIHCNGERLHLMVNDNGCGFNPEEQGGEDHRGLMIMRERVQMIGGELEIISTPGKGTTVWGDLPQKEVVYAAG